MKLKSQTVKAVFKDTNGQCGEAAWPVRVKEIIG